MVKYNHLIFDIDGTLVDNERAILLTWQEALEELLGKHYELEELQFVLGSPGITSMERLGVAELEQAFRRWGNIFKSHREDIRLFDGIQELITTLYQQGVRLGIVTSRLRTELNNDNALGEIIGYFSTVICVTDAPHPKPHAAPLLAYMQKECATPSETLYIGDSDYDCQCAANAGVDFVRALWDKTASSTSYAEPTALEPADILRVTGMMKD